MYVDFNKLTFCAILDILFFVLYCLNTAEYKFGLKVVYYLQVTVLLLTSKIKVNYIFEL